MADITQHLRERIESGQWLPGQRLATEKELAIELGVSTATIQRSMGQLQQDGLIRARRGSGRFVSEQASIRRTREIMVIIAKPTHMFNPVMIDIGRGIAATVEEAGYHLKYWAIHSPVSETPDLAAWNSLLRSGRTEGLIVATQQIPHDWLLGAAEKIPVVWMHSIANPPRLSSIAIDYLGGAYLAGRHLVELGHRRIALLTSHIGDSIAQAQFDGVRLAMIDLLPRDEARLDVLRAPDQSHSDGGRLTARQWLDTAPAQRATAIIGGSNELTLGFYEEVAAAGIRVPQDLSLVGWNDKLTQQQISIPLTSVRVHYEEGGRRSARQLIKMIENPGFFPEPQCVESNLVVWESTRAL